MWGYFELLRVYTNVWMEPINIGTLVVKLNVIICGRVPSLYRNLCRYQVLCAVVLRLLSFKEEKEHHGQNAEIKFVIICPKSGNIWYTDYLRHVLCCKIIKTQIDLKLKARSEFPNVWGEYKNHSNPYIQGATVPCDIQGTTIPCNNGKA